MKFTTNTKPLNDAISLGIINANINALEKRSKIVQLTASKDRLRINVETSRIKTQIDVMGTGDEGHARIFVSSVTFKQLMSTITSPTVTLEFIDGGVVIQSGRSKFTIPQSLEIEAADTTGLNTPEIPEDFMENSVALDKRVWKYVKDNQMFAIATKYAHPIYCNVFVGADNYIMVGDYDNSIFTCSYLETLGNQCLFSPTIVNMLISLPDGSKITKINDSYLVFAMMDSYTYVSQFTPFYEGDNEIGSYHSEIFLEYMKHSDEEGVVVNASELTNYLARAEMLSKEAVPAITVIQKTDCIVLRDNNVNCEASIAESSQYSYEGRFNVSFLKNVMSHYGNKNIRIKPIYGEDNTLNGILVWDDILVSMLACGEG